MLMYLAVTSPTARGTRDYERVSSRISCVSLGKPRSYGSPSQLSRITIAVRGKE